MDDRRAAEAEIARDAGEAARRLAEGLAKLRADLLDRVPMSDACDADARAAGAEALMNAERAARRLAETASAGGAASPTAIANEDSGPANL